MCVLDDVTSIVDTVIWGGESDEECEEEERVMGRVVGSVRRKGE